MTDPIEILKTFFGYEKFRPGQLEIINSILNKKDTLAIMPTGGGKSICYQIPSLIFQGLTIVISPLIALMKDQVDVLNSKGIPASFINSSLSNEDINLVYKNLFDKKIKLLYLAPERVNSKQFIEIIKQLEISFIAIDEAHCISEWGHDFRPSYREIVTLTDLIFDVPTAAFTATATPEVKNDIISSIRMNNPFVVQKSFERSNLSYKIEFSKDKLSSITKLLKGIDGSAMIYCGSRKRVEKIYYELKNTYNKVAYYHAGLHENFRRQEQENFLSGKKNIIVATSAFGMGIDKPDVRLVIHTDLTPTLESYYQEAGRAGRDGNNSECILLFDESDRGLQEFFISMNYPNLDKILKVYNLLYDIGGVKEGEFPKSTIQEDVNKLAVKLAIDITEFRAILKFLEKQNILKWGKSYSKIRVRVIASRDRIVEFFNNCDDEQRNILEAILRSFPISELNNFQEIDTNELFRKFNIKKEILDKNLRKLEFAEIIKTNSMNINGIHLLLARSGKNEYPFDTKKFINKKNNLIEKLNNVEEYVKTNSCKRNFILDYFGEKTGSNCGKCTWCLGYSYNTNIEKDKYILRTIKDAKRNFTKESTKTFFKDLLFGSKSKMILERKLNENIFYGELKGASKDDFDKAWNETKGISSESSIYDEILAGFTFRDICKNKSLKPSKLAKDIMMLDLTFQNLKVLFDAKYIDMINDYIKENKKATARLLQQNLDLDLNFIELKLIIQFLKKI
jgi:ATP-dependent DNA helicase RecQ